MEPNIPSPEDAISHLSSDESLTAARLTDLNNLGSQHMDILRGSWPSIDTERKRKILRRLVELAEDDIELNFDAIFKYALKDSDPEVRAQAVEGLWENEETSLIDPLINLLSHDDSEQVQAAAALALGKFALLAEHEKLRPIYRDRIQKALLSSFNDTNKSVDVRRRALEAVASISLPQVKQAIKKAYHGTDDRLKISSVYAMGKSCDPAWITALVNETTNRNAEIRYEAAGALGELEDESAVPSLVKLISDHDIDVRMAAIQALGKIGTAQAVASLKQCLESNNEAVRDAAEQALSELDAREDTLHFKL